MESSRQSRWIYPAPSSCDGAGDTVRAGAEEGTMPAIGTIADDICQKCDIYTLYNSVLYEFRNSLQGLKGCLEILKESGNSREQDEVLAAANQCTLRLNELVESMGECLKGTPSTPLIEEVPSVLTDLCSGVCDQYRLEAIQKRLTLYFDYSPAMIGSWLLDRAKVRQLFSALLGYSLRISTPGSSVCVRLQPSGEVPSSPAGFTMEVSCLTDTQTAASPCLSADAENPLDYCLGVIKHLSELLQGTVRWSQNNDRRVLIDVFLPSRFLDRSPLEGEAAEL